MSSIDDRIADIKYKIEVMKQYLDLQVHEEDWHGVQDAASDIRDYVAQLKALESVL